MRLKNFVGILIFYIFIFNSLSYSRTIFEDVSGILIDGFEKPGEWVLKFSKYRSKNWENNLEKDYEDSNTWLKWLSTDNYLSDKILPHGILKKLFLKETEKTILAIRGKWDFSGYNWIAIEPARVRAVSGLFHPEILELFAHKETLFPKYGNWKEGRDPNFIWLSGKVKQISLYVWGTNTNYLLEMHFQDYYGNNYVVPAGKMNFKGWKYISVLIPNKIRQSGPKVSNLNFQPIRFVRLKILADPNEKVTYMHTYFDYLFSSTDIYEKSFFGEDLRFVDKYWGDNIKSNNNSNNS